MRIRLLQGLFCIVLVCPGMACIQADRTFSDYTREENQVLLALLLAPAAVTLTSSDSDGTTTSTTPQRYVIFQAGGSTATALVDLTDLTTISSGPTATGSFNTNCSASLISGGARNGSYWLTGSGTSSYFFDPSTQTFANGPGLDVGYGNNANAWVVSSGTHTNKIYLRFGQGWAGTDRYNPSTDLNEASPLASNGGSGTAGSHSFIIEGGVQAGKRMIFIGGNTNGELYDPAGDSFAAGPAIGGTIAAGSHSMKLDSGSYLIPDGGATATTRLYDPASNTFGAGPALGCNCSNGCHSTKISGGVNDGDFLTVCGGSSTLTRIYDQTGGTYGGGPSLSALAGSGAQTFSITSGTNAGKLWIIHGASTNSTSLYDPGTNTISAGPTLPIAPGGVLNVPLP